MANKKNILFVDDEPNILQGLKRMFHSMRNEWEMFFASGGEEALSMLSEHTIDVIVSDMKMPNMNGAELLNRVQTLYPQTIRIILSGHSDEEMILKAAKSTHQYLAKPSNAETIKNTINRIYSLRYVLINEKIIRIVAGIENLPSLPSLYYQLMDELQSNDSSIKKIGDIISKDITMTAKILQFVNSAFFGLPQHISNPHEAVSLLGVNLIKSLIISVGVFSAFKIPRESGLSMEELWEHSMMVGILAKKIMKLETNEQKKVDDAMIAGLLHDIGKLLMIRLDGYSKNIRNIMMEKDCLYHEAEYEIFEISHAEVGAYLLVLWGLPDSIIEPVAFHHTPSKATDIGFSILTAIHIANAFFSAKDDSFEKDVNSYLDHDYLKKIKFTNKIDECKELYLKLKEKGATYEA